MLPLLASSMSENPGGVCTSLPERLKVSHSMMCAATAAGVIFHEWSGDV